MEHVEAVQVILSFANLKQKRIRREIFVKI